MSYSFVVAGRLPMSRDAFGAWLDAPVPGPAVISNPGDMFAGWYWDDRPRPEDWSDAPATGTPRDLLAARDPEDTITVVRHERGALEAYLWTPAWSGAWAPAQQRLLLMLAGARVPGHVLFWEDAAGALPDADSLLALLSVTPDRARFLGRTDIGPLLDELRPVEEAFSEAAADPED
ncbi:hypothetical protein [Catenuloplanes indicus]|uniref:Uncharacterized protein n=1 Tax=Catenuloplanes indicus TaxID=137267 RepID=A0AAE3W9L0_9ACTN|nr:hypothetical protein [Catenuloplanes indicus]MDQ0371189.1 hypothetical protein [Catenuloplanes indicus]